VGKFLRFSIVFTLLTSILILSSSSLAAELAEIKRRGKLIVAVKDNLRPLGFKDERGNLQGLEIDIARRLAQELLGSADAIILQPVSNQERLESVLQGKVDLAIAKVTATYSRYRLVDFSRFYYVDGISLIAKKRQFNHLDSSKIAVLNNSTTVSALARAFPQAKLVGVDSYREAFNFLEEDRVDAFAGDRSILVGWIQSYPEYFLLPNKISSEPLGVVMPKGLQYQELRDRVNEALLAWEKSGWLQERIKYWQLL
jgi:polar amino acid transport system substrate-binding protein